MKIVRTVGPKGQVVVPKDVREYLGLKPGSKITFEVKEKELIIRPETDPEKFVDEFCSVVSKKLKKPIDIKKIIEEEYEERLGRVLR
ncbi:MAG: AbrB/MazE/SpoVT family DNA-binding domain-containing protein [Hadesarchaea archaeon]|nr:AbrB/MazE/SpoVT family DNA-binding domain-containing protein [Hadesarchaea archaeon]